MPTCTYCNKVFKDRQALGNHIRTHLDDSDEDIPLTNQSFHDTSIQIHNPNIFTEETNVTIHVERNIHVERRSNDNQQEEITFDADGDAQNINISSSAESQSDDEEVANFSDNESMTESSDASDEDSVTSDLSHITNVDANEYTEYDALFSEISDDSENIQQEFPSEEYAEFMHMITQFHVQDSFANAFIKFFNKYSNRNDKPLPSTSQAGRIFVENLQVPSLDWRKEIIFEYKGIEYNFEYRTVLDGIRQILMNRDITKDFIFESVKDTSNQRQYTDMYNSDWWRNHAEIKQMPKFYLAIFPVLNIVVHLKKNQPNWPEACAMGTIYGSSNALHPCHFCLVDRDSMNNIHIIKEDIIIRDENNTKIALRQGNRYTDLDLNEFEKSIIIWSDLFIKLMSRFLRSNLNLPKLHSWRFHLIPSIYQFGAVSGFTSETYELLHKTNVKQLYRASSKYYDSYIKTSRIYSNHIYHGIISKKFIKKLTQHTIDQFIDQIRNNQNLNNLLWLRSFEKLKSCIYDYFQDIEEWSIQDIENETIKINVSEFAYLDNSQNHIIICATPNYYGQACFSDVCIEMDESEQDDYLTDNGLCYAKVLLIIQVLSTKLEKNLELALVYWYDFAYYDHDDNDTQHRDDDNHNNHYFYKCAILKHVDHYTLIPIASIANIVHIIPKFDMSNVFYVNKYIEYY
ncbi:unnamed protein product [Rhizophagus irregularis]|nr:unnamed protein product [Rhizophagus irregularis]